MYQGDSLYVLTFPVLVYVVWRCAVHRTPFTRTLAWAALVIYTTEVLSRTLFPLPVDAQFIALERAHQFGSHNFVLLRTIRAMLSHPNPQVRFTQVVGNFLLLAPMGYLAPLLFRRLREVHRAIGALAIAVLSIECTQLLLSTFVFGFVYKSFDVDDILLNLLGGAVGYGVFKLVETGVRRSGLDGIASGPAAKGDPPPATVSQAPVEPPVSGVAEL